MSGRGLSATLAQHWRGLAVTGLLLAGLGLRLWGIGFGAHTPLARPDEETFILNALQGFHGFEGAAILRWGFPVGHFRLDYWVIAAQRWWLQLVTSRTLNLGCLYLYYPAFFSLGIRLLSVLMDLACTALVGLGARQLARPVDRDLAQVLATAAYALNYLAGREAHFAVANSGVNLGVALCLWFCILALQKNPRWLVAAGAAAGGAFGLKYSAIPLLAPCGASWFWLIWRRPDKRAMVRLGLAGTAAACLVFLFLSPEVLWYPAEFVRGLAGQQNRYSSQGVAGYLIDPAWNSPPGWRFHFFYNLPIAFGWPGYLLGLAGLGLAARQARWVALPLLAFEGASVVMIAPIAALFVRYADPLIPGLAIGVGLVLARLTEAVWRKRGPALGVLGLAALLLLAFGPPAMRLAQFDDLMAQRDTRDLAQDWLVAHGGTAATLGNYTRVHLIEPNWENACADHLPASWTAGSWPETPDMEPQEWPRYLREEPRLIDKVVLDAVYHGTDIGRADYLFWSRPDLMCGKPGRSEGPPPPANCFQKIEEISPGDPACDSTLDMYDMFFVPYEAFAGQQRPGPKVEIYRNTCKQH